MYIENEKGEIVSSPIHAWFGLGRVSYFTIPRLALEAMPLEWQERFIRLMDDAHEKHGMVTPNYTVLRDDPKYTMVENYDPDDHSSRPYTYSALTEDEWADYRRGDVEKLKEELLN